MKRLFILAALLLAATTYTAAQSYTREGNTFTQVSPTRTAADPVKTAYTWKDKEGNVYPIYQSPSGSCFIIRTSKKSGKEYRQYLGKEISAQIAKETGVTYNPKATKK